jgi:hypothetical protein
MLSLCPPAGRDVFIVSSLSAINRLINFYPLENRKWFFKRQRKEMKRAGGRQVKYGTNLPCLTTEDNLLSATDEKQHRGYVVNIMDIMFANKLFKTLLTNHPVIFPSAFSLSGEQHWRNAL